MCATDRFGWEIKLAGAKTRTTVERMAAGRKESAHGPRSFLPLVTGRRAWVSRSELFRLLCPPQ
jgi:hypothetical protein